MPTLIGYHGYVDKEGKGFLVNSDGDVCDKGPYLEWLLNAVGEGVSHIAYDMDAFCAVLFKLIDLTVEEAQKMMDKDGRLHVNPYSLTYFAGKYFSVKTGGYGGTFFGMTNAEQYFEGPSIEDNADPAYSIQKAEEARDKGREVSRIFYDLKWSAQTLTSPIRSLEKTKLKGLNWPTHKDCPAEVNDLALRSCRGPWIEAFSLGHWPEAYDYDRVSSYPADLAELYDTRRGDWILSPEKPEGAVYGFVDGEVDIQAPFSPVLYRGADAGGDFTYSPTGPRPDQITNFDLDFIREFGLGDMKVETGWWWIPNGGPQYQPAKGLIRHLFAEREETEGLKRKLIKRASSALWGKTLAMYGDDYAPTFMPVWGSLVESMTRCAVARFVLENKLTVLSVAVDGIIAEEKVEVPETGEMGSWRMSHAGGVIILSGGIAAVEGKIGAEDFSLRFDWLKKAIEDAPEASEYQMKKLNVCTLAYAMATDYEKLGQVQEITKTIMIGTDSKRLYFDAPMTGGELLANQYDSEPMDMSLIIGQGVQG